jgi:hypothetical protein
MDRIRSFRRRHFSYGACLSSRCPRDAELTLSPKQFISCWTIYLWTVTHYGNLAYLMRSPWSFTIE